MQARVTGTQKGGPAPSGNARQAAAAIVLAQLRTGSFPDRNLEQVTEDRALVAEIVYGIMRRRRALRWILDRLVPRHPGEELEAAVLVGLYQLLFLSGVKTYAAINETVEAAKNMVGVRGANLVNAVLRRVDRDKEALLKELERQPLAVRLSHPDVLVTRWTARYGADGAEALCRWDNERPDTVLRVALAHTDLKALRTRIQQEGIEASPHPYAPEEYLIVPRNIRIDDLPGYAEGLFAVQDPATALAVARLDPQPGQRVLDACAAPGGKAMLIAERMRNEGLLVAMDLHEDRLEYLRANAERLGHGFMHIMQGKAEEAECIPELKRLAPAGFDRILLDVPCTNTGVLRRRPDARWRFSESRLSELTRTQWAILDAVSRLLAPGGRLVYSTCSLEPEENDGLVGKWLAGRKGHLLTGQEALFPPKTRTDGAFVAVLVKA